MGAARGSGCGRGLQRLAGLLGAAAFLAPAGAGLGATSQAEVTVSGGSLSLTTPDFQALSATLTGVAQIVSTTPATPWNAVDARGTGAPWSVVASATNLVSAGSPNRVIPSAALSITTGEVTADTGADATTGMVGAVNGAFLLPTGTGQTNVVVLAAPGPHRGSYSFTPRLDVAVPGTAAPSYPGSPYTTTLTLTVS